MGCVAHADCDGWALDAWPRAAEPGAEEQTAALDVGPEVVGGWRPEGG